MEYERDLKENGSFTMADWLGWTHVLDGKENVYVPTKTILKKLGNLISYSRIYLGAKMEDIHRT